MSEWTDAQKDAHIRKIEQRDQQFDLDALDERTLRVIGPDGLAGMFLPLADWAALIQRLREAEAEALDNENAANFNLGRAVKAEAENERLQGRIAQLERVRELVGEMVTWEPVQKEMRAALAAVEEPVKS